MRNTQHSELADANAKARTVTVRLTLTLLAAAVGIRDILSCSLMSLPRRARDVSCVKPAATRQSCIPSALLMREVKVVQALEGPESAHAAEGKLIAAGDQAVQVADCLKSKHVVIESQACQRCEGHNSCGAYQAGFAGIQVRERWPQGCHGCVAELRLRTSSCTRACRVAIACAASAVTRLRARHRQVSAVREASVVRGARSRAG